MDLAFVVFVGAVAALGWFRGFLAQIAGVGAAVALWATFDLWYPPIDLGLAGLGPAFSDYPYLRRIVGFLGAWMVAQGAIFVLEVALVRRSGALETGNRILGVGVGALKGCVYATALLWMVEASVLWGKPSDEPRPGWLTDSSAVAQLGPYNPVRVFTLKEAMENVAAERARDGDRSGSERRTNPDEDPQAAPEALEDSGRVRTLYKASPIRKLLEEAAGESEWQGRGYGDLVMDPRVREALGDADFVELLLGE